VIRLLRELRQRKVFRGAGYYLLAGWAVLQVGDVIVEPAGLPGWSMTALLYLLIIGFPVAMVFSWRYDIGEHGIVRTRDDGDDAPPEPLRAVDYLLFAGLVAISAAALYQVLPVAQQSEQSRSNAAAPTLENLRPNSIAVLPFADISQGGNQQFLGDGISDTVMHVLSQIAELSVTARTSSFAFKDKNLSIPEIAAALSVAHVLEGSVQTAGDKVRIIARLIDARVGTEIWSGYYDRAVDSIFAIQDEIAQEVATALTTEVLKTGESQQIETGYRPRLDAYEQFILGKQQLALRNPQGYRAAREFFERAIALDPKYALAHAFLAQAIVIEAGSGMQDRRQAFEQAGKAIASALDLEPQLAEAHGVNAMLLVQARRFPEAEAAISRALELQPSYADVYATHAQLLFIQGQFDESLSKIRKAIELDPQENRYRTQLAVALWSVSRAEEAVAIVKEGIERNPRATANYLLLSRWSGQLGNVGHEAYWSHQAGLLAPDTHTSAWVECLSLLQLWANERAESCIDAFLQQYPGDTEASQYLALLTNDPELGLSTLRAAVAGQPSQWYRRYQLAEWLVRVGEWQETIDTLKPVAPRLFLDNPEVDDFTVWAAINIARAAQGLGDESRAQTLLEAVLGHVDRRRKLQATGYIAGVEDVQALLLLGREDEALARLQRSVDAGWRFYSFGLQFSFYDPWRDDPRFIEAYEQVRDDMAAQLAWFDEHRGDPIATVGI
jgi:TolB-like protein/Tfp pilus assembly protein PilF